MVYMKLAALAPLLFSAEAFVLPGLFQQEFATPELQQFLEVNGELTPQVIKESLDANFWKPHVPYFLKPLVETEKLQEKIQLEDLNTTAQDLYELAKKSRKKYGHPTRVIGSPGHWATIDYILEALDGMSDYYNYTLQEFDALSGKVNSFNLTDAKTGISFPNSTAFSLSPPVKPFVGELIEIPNLGCNEADYKSLEIFHGEQLEDNSVKKIALIERGKCPFGVKSNLAGKYGFHAAVIYDNEPENGGEGLHGTLGEPTNTTISTIGVSYDVGVLLVTNIEITKHYSVKFAMDSTVSNIKTKNIIADTKHGDPENIVALGAHSDSVEEGPGINDDGSGTISLLTVAKQLTHFKINNKVRFAWWSAEEEGLLGSNYYAYNLTQEENNKIRVFMDYDMMASPNYEYEIYDANNKDHPKGSEELKKLYIDFYKHNKLNYTLIPFDGRSDYVGFIENGIPAGGIAAGAEKNNVWNGQVLDRCYHQLCDDLTNLAWDAFLINTKLIAHSVATYANSFEGFPLRNVNGTVNTTETSVASTNNVYNEVPVPQFKYAADYLVY
ncbi:similar to Saccharomyces cerevisiae YBR286W APE3 Vacuolar aminopeptidase Y, processed to mature form by Prb1p [Maudiozyma barnettii]|uniref:Peptide hydrolase n=1 Tax=Maudiozyma barnettii TaxID=61262 RepID=A0A8H2VFI0_9SACH|nr:aminopeptidase Y [Kazachstania barnettii]CAB4254565.1 similar to Saccharomyces cerevisiae YBR286W APE3 Vacuolar aminopeptidase Y, processed to mature form by Prb1p [Kazachstania barnettii]CAD1782607.1 similar to Saccharomyces cerevisiae YBR286W APE3 Vacuolar aminopeptidase Y, processed to mature form by Prb1p [Kazachstania barnettii]